MHVRGGLARRRVVGPRREEGDNVMIRDGFDRRDPLWRWWRSGPDGPDAVGGHYSGRRVRLEDEGLDPAPQLVLVRFAPDPAHLGQRVALDHGHILAQGAQCSCHWDNCAAPCSAGTGSFASIRSIATSPAVSRPSCASMVTKTPSGIVASANADTASRKVIGPVCSAARNAAVPLMKAAAPTPSTSAACGLGSRPWPTAS